MPAAQLLRAFAGDHGGAYRCTSRLTVAHRSIGFSVGGKAGSRLAEHLDMPTSPVTLLRRVQQAGDEPMPAPRYVGIDDWAIRKGQRYGTIVIDFECRRIVDLLPGRDGEAIRKWLEDHPGVEVITRDRWGAFANAASSAAPQALQFADRWHLPKSMREAVERVFAENTGTVRDALADKTPVDGVDPAIVPASATSTASASQPGDANIDSSQPNSESNAPLRPIRTWQTRIRRVHPRNRHLHRRRRKSRLGKPSGRFGASDSRRSGNFALRASAFAESQCSPGFP
jgi:hypothetical protein